MQVVCINDKNRPKRIPPEKWIKEGETYTVIGATKMNIQLNKIGLKLKEIELDHSCFPYEYFDADRFKPVEFKNSLVKEEELSLEEI